MFKLLSMLLCFLHNETVVLYILFRSSNILVNHWQFPIDHKHDSLSMEMLIAYSLMMNVPTTYYSILAIISLCYHYELWILKCLLEIDAIQSTRMNSNNLIYFFEETITSNWSFVSHQHITISVLQISHRLSIETEIWITNRARGCSGSFVYVRTYARESCTHWCVPLFVF